jgi:hypothetical protein
MIRKNFNLKISLGIENFIKKEMATTKKSKKRLKLKLYLLISNKAHKIPTNLANGCTIV